VAEFAEVWKQWKRMCLAVKGNGDQSCENCKLCNLECDAEYPKDQNYYDGKTIEAIIMSWAAEHTEPVYPTWEEWLQSIGVMESSEGLLRRIKAQLYIDGIPAHAVPTSKVLQPIPADIAKKLGIKPRETKKRLKD